MTTSDNVGLLDTNVLVYAADELSPHYRHASTLRDKGLRGDIALSVTPQVLAEFFAIVTDPKRVKQARTQKEAVQEIEKYLRAQNVLKIHPQLHTMDTALELLKRYSVKGQEVFDLQLVATMLSNGISRIYTYNNADFAQYQEVEAITPAAVLQ